MPPKVTFFAWEATLGKALSLDQVKRKVFSLAKNCFLCQKKEEIADLTYLLRKDVSSMAVTLLSLSLVLLGSFPL